MRIEIIHERFPDAPCEHTVFIDGEREHVSVDDGAFVVLLGDRAADSSGGLTVVVDVYDVDPGAGYSLGDWNGATEHDCAQASEACAAHLRSVRDDIAKMSEYIERGSCIGSSSSEIIEEQQASDAGISSRYQCDDCGAVLSSPDEPHSA